jgi:hypothetical protein
MDNAQDTRYIIKAKTPQYYEEIKKLYHAGLSRAQVHRILEITKGNIVGLKVAKHVGERKIWFAFAGRRYDVKHDGTMTEPVKTGVLPPVVVPKACKKIKCQLCGEETPIPQYDVKARCPKCGFQLVRYNVIHRR